jgi:NitT/TauT family transport system ATP-binding protein
MATEITRVSLQHVHKIYGTNSNRVLAIEDLSLDISPEEILCLVGPSGCGKTTLLDLIAGFSTPTGGHILINGSEAGAPDGTRGVVFQSDSVFPWMTVEQNVGYGLSVKDNAKGFSSSDVANYLRLVGLSDFASRWPRELSGGMRKRVDLARAYALKPELLLLDEPFGSLDVLTKEEMQLLLLDIWQTEKKTVLFVTHDVEEAIFLGHRVAVMTPRPGSIRQTLEVPFPMPRAASLKLAPEFLDLRRQVTEALKGE